MTHSRPNSATPRDGYYGCKMPPGYCGCPQETRVNCRNGVWVQHPEDCACSACRHAAWANGGSQ
jgi:hypothetical protein